MPRSPAGGTQRARGARRTFDGASGRVLGVSTPLGDASTDYVDFGLNPADANSSAWDGAGTPGGAELGQPTPNLPAVTVSATPVLRTASAGPLGIPWWAWALLGIAGGYWLARNYGKHISRGFSYAGALSAPR